MTATPDLSNLRWRKSVCSNNQGGDCVEVAELPDGGRAVRDSKRPADAMLRFTSSAWRTFVHDLKSGTLH